MNIDHFEEVFAYLHGEMSPDQMQLFEQRLSVDSSLAEEFQIQQRNIKEDSGKFESTLNALHRELQSPAVIFAKLKPQVDEIVHQTLKQLYEEDIKSDYEPVGEPDSKQLKPSPEPIAAKRISINRNTFSLLKIAAVLIPLIIIGVGIWLLNKRELSHSNNVVNHVSDITDRDSLPDTKQELASLVRLTIDELSLPSVAEDLNSEKRIIKEPDTKSVDTKNTPTDSPILSETKTSLSEPINSNDHSPSINNFCTLNSSLSSLKKGQYKEAQYSFENLLRKNCLSSSNITLAKYYLALAFLEQGNNELYDKAQNLLNQAIPNLPLLEKEKAINIVALLKQK